MRVRKINQLLARAQVSPPHETPLVLEQLGSEFGTLLHDLGARLRELQAVIGAAELGPRASTVELLMRGLTDELALPDHRPPDDQRRAGDPITSWREVSKLLAEGADSLGLPDWAGPAFRQLTSILTDEMFPCLFARQTNHLRSGWFAFVDELETEAGREDARRAVIAYYDVLRRYPRERTIIMPLLIVVKPHYPMLSLREYFEQAWGLFQYLHDHDPEEWPIDVPTDPDRGDWSFCFGGRQLFSNVSAPAHRIHKSRNLGDSLVFAMQPRTNFDLVGGNNKKGRAVRTEIRKRVERYEGRPVSSHLGFYGTPENREWAQMASRDSEDDPDYPSVCPFRFNGKTNPTRRP